MTASALILVNLYPRPLYVNSVTKYPGSKYLLRVKDLPFRGLLLTMLSATQGFQLPTQKAQWNQVSYFSHLPQKCLTDLVILFCCLSLFQSSLLSIGTLKSNTEDNQVTNVCHVLELMGKIIPLWDWFQGKMGPVSNEIKAPFRGAALRAVVEAGCRHCLLTSFLILC